MEGDGELDGLRLAEGDIEADGEREAEAEAEGDTPVRFQSGGSVAPLEVRTY